jgi:hypothetical protein
MVVMETAADALGILVRKFHLVVLGELLPAVEAERRLRQQHVFPPA